VLKDIAGVELRPAARKTIDLEGRMVKDAVRKALKDRQTALDRTWPRRSGVSEQSDQPLTVRGSDHAHAAQELNKAIDRGEGLLE
jgi:hypothetical protein